VDAADAADAVDAVEASGTRTPRPQPAGGTRGRVIRWARPYDPLVRLLTLGRAGALRAETAALAGTAPGATRTWARPSAGWPARSAASVCSTWAAATAPSC
jgi:hypothetical protein